MSTISLVTGSSRGLGRATAHSIARKGGDVIITYQSREADAMSVVADIQKLGRKAVALPLNTADVSTFATFAERLESVLNQVWARDSFDHLVNNAGHGEVAPIADMTEAAFDKLVDVHFKGVFFLTQKLLPLLADGGRIVNLSTGLTRVSAEGWSAYAAVKGAIEVLTVYMAKEFGHRKIAVNAVAPGAIETDFFGGAVRDTPEFNQFFAGMTALGRVGVVDDIGPMIAGLLSEDNRWVNAQRIEVSGGQGI
ncbi:SDR family NAD(P)-dependent oxidoreductase [Dyella sp.]|uniref:SDR family NAD(P)-dependent oxidoreductase n=1 Tax=Dyella sp. TaxID=1869338 RepID=UPI0031B8690F